MSAMSRDDRAGDEQAKANAARRTLRPAASERFKHERQHLWGNRRTPVMNGEHHGIALLLPGESDGRSAAVLYRVADQIRHDLREPVDVPLAAQISAGLKPHDCLRSAGTD